MFLTDVRLVCDKPFSVLILLPLELEGPKHRVVGVLTFWIAIHFEIFEHVLSCVFHGGVDLPSGTLMFQQLEGSSGNGIAMAVAATAQTGFQILLT